MHQTKRAGGWTLLVDDFLPIYDVSAMPTLPQDQGGWILLGERPREEIALDVTREMAERHQER